MHIKKAYIQVTDFCNLSCKYCFEKGHVKKKSVISMENLHQAIELIKRHKSSSRITIDVFGGAALDEFDKIIYVLKQNIPGVIVALSTNGLLLNEEHILQLYDYKDRFRFIISAEGTRYAQDTYKPLFNGKSSFDALLKSNVWDVKLFPNYVNYVLQYPDPKQDVRDSIRFWKQRGFNKFQVEFCLDTPNIDDAFNRYEEIMFDIAEDLTTNMVNCDFVRSGSKLGITDKDIIIAIDTAGDVYLNDYFLFTRQRCIGNIVELNGELPALPEHRLQSSCKECPCQGWCSACDAMKYYPQNELEPTAVYRCRTSRMQYEACKRRYENNKSLVDVDG